ncbi:unnamed protein product [Caenorhabditis sp. 36 PRJEB53466]|nr:unnamed protein product [Caenorhabditis sp. 36 PRJEB53466]
MSSNSSISTDYNFSNGLSFIAAVLIAIVGIFGVITNSSIAYIFYKEKSERSAFNLICVFRSVSNVIILTATFLFVFFPKIIIGSSLYPPALESWLIHLSLSLYLGNEYQIILVALNRFCALFAPTYYARICGLSPTLIALILMYSYRIFKLIVELIPQTAKNCYTCFSTELLSWVYDPNPDCAFEDDILQVILYTFITMTFINVVTFLKIIKFQPKEYNGKGNGKRIRRNILLFFQTILQDSLYLIDLTFTFKLSGLSTHRFWTFVSGTFVWECIHSIDGFIMIMFNERLSFLKKRFQQPTPSISLAGRLKTVAVSNTLPSVG